MAGPRKPYPKKGSCQRFVRAFWVTFPHGCLVCSLVLYSVVGAFIFTYLEGSRDDISSDFDEFLLNLWNLSQSYCTEKGHNDAQENFKNISRLLIVDNVKGAWLQKPEITWNFLGSLFFCCTVITTVGYGNTFPVTFEGKMACIVYAAIGIPLMLLVLTDLGDLLAALLTKTYNNSRAAVKKLKLYLAKRHSSSKKQSSRKSSLALTLDNRVSVKEPLNLTEVLKSQTSVKRNYLHMRNIDIFEHIIDKESHRLISMKVCRFQRSHSCPQLDFMPSAHSAIYDFDKIGEELGQLELPIVLIILIMVGYIMCGALILPLWETNWVFSDAFYFCFITLTTIGFGDIVPEHPNYFLLLSAYLVVGIAIGGMAFKLGQNRIVCFYKRCVSCISGGNVKRYSSDIEE
ncbi:potassium channel subfamily K member 18 [Bombina bombina]|uniref:potassium channel subfamily K member 18 n=1 Tax=Bombina bombina TaxID=8345 RepID=UPI00235AD900|nr:potassium channel subfamily K member 18 [Bombina bombina]